MNLPEVLLAKSRVAGRGELTLEQHLLDTEQAAIALFSPEHRLFRNWKRFFKMDDEARSFLLHLRVAGLLHDLGKANADFYRAVTHGDPAQTIRHEHLSAILLFEPSLPELAGEVAARANRRREVSDCIGRPTRAPRGRGSYCARCSDVTACPSATRMRRAQTGRAYPSASRRIACDATARCGAWVSSSSHSMFTYPASHSPRRTRPSHRS